MFSQVAFKPSRYHPDGAEGFQLIHGQRGPKCRQLQGKGSAFFLLLAKTSQIWEWFCLFGLFWEGTVFGVGMVGFKRL